MPSPSKGTPSVTIAQAVGLGLLQGLTEFLPVSSSGHLVLARALFQIEGAAVTFEVLLHLASLVAILIYFRREILSVFTTRRRLIVPLVVGTIPAAVVGVLLRHQIETMFDKPLMVGVALLFTATVLLLSERLATDERSLDQVKWEDGLWIGMAQAIALLPGVSRSGMTVGGGLASGLERRAAVAFAFLLGAIAIAGAGVLKAKDMVKEARMGEGRAAVVESPPATAETGAGQGQPSTAHGQMRGAMAAGFVAALVASLAALALLVHIVRRKCLIWFAIYCYAVGGCVVLAKLTGLW